ncbi:MAG: type II pantothenate kinase [Oscillospiraceae bacterium]|nr:type II pantothenate kinase [Oscillospiraceae bacterium]
MYIIGIDIGGSTTKICGFKIGDKILIKPLFIKASNPVASLYGAFGEFTYVNKIKLSEIQKIHVTGVGSTFISDNIHGINTEIVSEFEALGRGGLYLSTLSEAIVVNMGTGTTIVMAGNNGKNIYLGGTGVGGGTLTGLSKMLLNIGSTDNIIKLAENGDLKNIDLRIGDITKKDIIPGMPDYMTASNFGKISDLATKSDIALGILNMIYETIGMISIFAARQFALKDIVLTGGTLTDIPQSREIFTKLNKMFGVNFQIPEYARFGTVIGAALCAEEIQSL